MEHIVLNFLKDLQLAMSWLVVSGNGLCSRRSSTMARERRHLGGSITSDYDKINTIQLHHPIGEIQRLDGHGRRHPQGTHVTLGRSERGNDHGFSRYGARPTLIVMTDV